ncbi:MAG: HNH endonuclease [Planctomycetes bacterium]|nr:HNH endonuclease [Planctomycetota bacterium]MBU4397872.1 HNH endonuclease [Planctomycetota bacterium]MCG2684429.1 HNH endonuclease [Planctomycetales bacterium]
MSSYIGEELRRLVSARAEGLCEYCLIHSDDTFFGCEVDHVISRKHGGPTQDDNLALACLFCNRQKGTDIASVLPGSDQLVPLFNPRRDRWADHFRLEGPIIRPLTPVGEATANILRFNTGDRILERRMLIAAGRYPSSAAGSRMSG